MGCFEIAQVGQIALPTHRSLHGDEIGEGADRRLDAVDATDVRPLEEQIEPDPRYSLGKQIQIAVGSGKVERSVAVDACDWHWGTVGARCAPVRDQRSDALDVFRIWAENRIHVTGRTDDTVTDQRDAADQYIANTGTVQVLENAAEAAHREGATRPRARSPAHSARSPRPGARRGRGRRRGSTGNGARPPPQPRRHGVPRHRELPIRPHPAALEMAPRAQARNETRTRDPFLTMEVLYQLSYPGGSNEFRGARPESQAGRRSSAASRRR